MTNHANMKLGRIRPTSKQRALAPRLKDYITAPLPPAPPTCRNSDGAAIGMWGNDVLGDCTWAALGNARAIDACKEGKPTPPTTAAAIEQSYLAFTSGQDTGCVESDVLNAALKGVNLGGPDPWMLAAWVSVNLRDLPTCKSLVALFWSLYLGVELPIAAQTQTLWTPGKGSDFAPGSWGGHALLLANYDTTNLGLITWGKEQLCTPDWLNEYGDEAYCLLDADRASVIGVNWDQLVSDLHAVSQNRNA